MFDSEIVTRAQTQEGMVMGTVPYMSPEQVQAQRVDHRNDIFSFGIILYEMASGRRPFQGNSGAALISSILRDRPRSVHEINRDLPEALSRIIDRCLEKNVEERFQTAREVGEHLDQLGHQVLAQAQFFRRDLKAFRQTAERAMSLNPLDGRWTTTRTESSVS